MFIKKIIIGLCLLCMSFTTTVNTSENFKNEPNVIKKAAQTPTKKLFLNTDNASYMFTTTQDISNNGDYIIGNEQCIMQAETFDGYTGLDSIIEKKEPIEAFLDNELCGIIGVDPSNLNDPLIYPWVLVTFKSRFDYDIATEKQVPETICIHYKGDKQAPTLTGTNNFVVNVNRMLSEAEILSHVKVTDDTDGPIIPTVKSTTYRPENKVTGQYNMVLLARDKAGNESEITIVIHVVDVDKPTLSAKETLSYSYKNIPTVEEILTKIAVTDNYDKNLLPKLVKDNYSTNGGIIGNYSIIVNSTDNSGNKSDDKTFEINIYDDIKPEITVNGLNSLKELHVPNNSLMLESKIKELIKVTDDYKQGNPKYTLIGYDSYQKVCSKAGSRVQMTINAQDSSGNQNQLVFTIVVDDKTKPTFSLDDYFVVLGQDVTLSKEQIKFLAARVANVDPADIKEVTLVDTTSPNIKTARIKMNDNRVFNINIETGVKINTIVMSWYHYIYKWFTVFFNIDKYYNTNSFFDLKTRCNFIKEIYTKGIFYKR